MALNKRIGKLLQGYKGRVKTAYQIREEWIKTKGSLAEEVIRMRTAE